MTVPANLIQIDLDAEPDRHELPGSPGNRRRCPSCDRGDLRGAYPQARPRDGWGTLWEEARSARPARPEWLIDTLRAALPSDVPVFTDACEIGYRMHADWISHGPRLFFYPSNYITLGWAFPAAVGAAVARGGGPGCRRQRRRRLFDDGSGARHGGPVSPARDRARAQRFDIRRDQEHPGPQSRRALSRRRAQQSRLPRARARIRRRRPPRNQLPKSSIKPCAKHSIATALR